MLSAAELIESCTGRVLGPGTSLGLENTIISAGTLTRCWETLLMWIQHEVGVAFPLLVDSAHALGVPAALSELAFS